MYNILKRDFELMSFFFVWLLVFESLSIMYFTLLNSDLRFWQGSSVACLCKMSLMLTCSDLSVNPKACEVQGRSPSRGCGGAKPPAHEKKQLKFLQSPAQKKSIISQNLRISQKSPSFKKWVPDPICPANLATFWRKLNVEKNRNGSFWGWEGGERGLQSACR